MKKVNTNPFASLQSYQEKKSLLASLSDQVIIIKLSLSCKTNEALRIFYQTLDKNAKEFKTFNQWKKDGKKVKKGSKAWAFWSRPIEGKSKKEVKRNGKSKILENKYDFFAMSYVFANNQVE